MRTAILLLSLAYLSARGAEFPQPYNSEPDKDAQPPSPAEAVGLIELPDGFTAAVYAAEPEVRNPIAMAWDHRGRIWVAENFTYAERAKRFDLNLRDRILVFHDRDGDGRADEHKVFADDLQMLTSVEVGDGGIWAMCPPNLLFIPDADGDDVPDGEPIIKLDGFTVAKSNYHNFANGLRWGPDGWLYGRCGHSCPGKPGKPGTPEAARTRMEGGIFRYHPDREVVEVITHGTTNPWGHDWDQHGELFFINTVNGHLWHGIPGAHFKESFGSSPNPGVYERLDMHADHWHFDTGQHWTKSRGGEANDFGGGHAHIGMMIYQAEQWPAPMRDRLYTLNMHGLRANVERLERHGSGYIGRHEDDVFLTGDQWFRGIDIQQGPDGSAYILDWSDTGECHDHTGVHRSSGRIYRISHGTPPKPDLGDLEKLTPEGIHRLIKNPNVWYERQLRRRLTNEHAITLYKLFNNKGTDTRTKLRTLWALNAIGEAKPAMLSNLLDHADEHIRAWAIRLLTDDQPIDTIMGPRSRPGSPPDIGRFVELAQGETSGLVRLTLASTLQRLPVQQRIGLGRALASRPEDAGDHNLPSIVWYGLIPLIGEDPEALASIAGDSDWPLLQRWTARGLAAGGEATRGSLQQLLGKAARRDTAIQSAILQGIGDAYKGWKSAPEPQGWQGFASSVQDPDLAGRIQKLSLLFGNQQALQSVKDLALDPSADLAARRSALQALIETGPPDLRDICERLLDQDGINANAARGLAGFEDSTIGAEIARRYEQFAPAERSAVIEVLVSRPAWAKAALAEMEAGRIPRGDLAAFHARQIRAFKDPDLDQQLGEIWGEMRKSSKEKRELIETWTGKLSGASLAGADLGAGRAVFQNVCGACHRLYGEGGTIGPDLTGSGRSDLGYLLENIADPGAVVSNDYRMTILTLKDGRIITGVVAAEDRITLTLRQIAGEVVIEKEGITKRERPVVSMMPEGLLLALEPDQVRDLIAYLQHPEQVELPGE
ncbi:MAG: PVC-type heme-binding CxxCH protein [Verrucomicrobiales bacterium]